MLIFGITGSINHGKSTLSAALVSQVPISSRHFTSFQVIASVADAMHRTTNSIPASNDIEAINAWLEPLPGILNQFVHAHCTFSQLSIDKQDVTKNPKDYAKLFKYLDRLKEDPSLLRQQIDESNVESYRPFLQWLGGYLVAKVSPGIWFEEIIRRAKDVEQQGIELCIIDGVRFINDAKLVRKAGGIVLEISRPTVESRDNDDPTERERDSIEPDILITNNGTIEDLRKLTAQILKDVRNNNYQKAYQAVAA